MGKFKKDYLNNSNPKEFLIFMKTLKKLIVDTIVFGPDYAIILVCNKKIRLKIIIILI